MKGTKRDAAGRWCDQSSRRTQRLRWGVGREAWGGGVVWCRAEIEFNAVGQLGFGRKKGAKISTDVGWLRAPIGAGFVLWGWGF